jgi:pimeloyl-ACP methyl ester carboxylesterase
MNRFTRIFLLFILHPSSFILLVACATAPQSLHLSPCTVAGAQARCGTFDVRESWQSRRVLALKVIVLPALVHNESPVFIFSGGPGEPVVSGAEFEVKEFAAERRLHDVVLVDARGTGESAPLVCPEAMKRHRHALVEDDLFPFPFIADCRSEIEAHADPAVYTFPYFVDDIEALRSALGYSKINIVGLSYGTRAALTFLERHPQSLRSILLVGPLPPENIMPLNTSRDAQAVIDRLIADSTASFPNLSSELQRVFSDLEGKPVEIKTGDYHLRINRGMFAEFLRSNLYAVDRQKFIPLMIHLAAQSDWAAIAPRFVRYRESWYDAIGPFMSITCPTDVRWIDPNDIPAATAGTLLGDYRVRRQMAACEQWTPGMTARTRIPRDSSVPILVITGELDPVTPPRWTAAIPKAHTIVLANSGHVDDMTCGVPLEVAFFDAGTFDYLDDSCAKTIKRPPFATKLP